MTEDEMAGWHHQLNGHGFGWTPGTGNGQGGLACCSSWEIDGETVETVADFIFLGSKITADGDCSHEIKRCSFEEKL